MTTSRKRSGCHRCIKSTSGLLCFLADTVDKLCAHLFYSPRFLVCHQSWRDNSVRRTRRPARNRQQSARYIRRPHQPLLTTRLYLRRPIFQTARRYWCFLCYWLSLWDWCSSTTATESVQHSRPKMYAQIQVCRILSKAYSIKMRQ